MDFELREMSIDQYDSIYELWENSEGVGLSQSDSKYEIEKFLNRNPGLCFTAWHEAVLVGAILCGHDGRRGYIHHLAVEPNARRGGVGTALVGRCLRELKAFGISKCHLFVFTDNDPALAFWRSLDWIYRDELFLMSQYT
jgi:ribosomal protein S18 acetylase RimI-like enzyme